MNCFLESDGTVLTCKHVKAGEEFVYLAKAEEEEKEEEQEEEEEEEEDKEDKKEDEEEEGEEEEEDESGKRKLPVLVSMKPQTSPKSHPQTWASARPQSSPRFKKQKK